MKIYHTTMEAYSGLNAVKFSSSAHNNTLSAVGYYLNYQLTLSKLI